MAQLLYALQFRGQAQPVSESPTVLKAATSAPSAAITTTVGPQGVAGRLEPCGGGSATFESRVTLGEDSEFQEDGTITFGEGHRLRFSTVGRGHLGPSVDPSLSTGVVMWRIDEGEGQFAGASGYITSNFSVSAAGEVVDNHFGVIFVP